MTCKIYYLLFRIIFTFHVILQLHELLSSDWLYYYQPFAGSTEIEVIDDDSVEEIKRGRLTKFIFCSIFFFSNSSPNDERTTACNDQIKALLSL